MPTMTVSAAREDLYGLIDEVAESHESICITGRRNQAVILSMADWQAIQETLYLNAIPGMAESIQEGMATPVSKCAKKVVW